MRCEPLRRGRHSKKVVYHSRKGTAERHRGVDPTSLQRILPDISTSQPRGLHKQELRATRSHGSSGLRKFNASCRSTAYFASANAAAAACCSSVLWWALAHQSTCSAPNGTFSAESTTSFERHLKCINNSSSRKMHVSNMVCVYRREERVTRHAHFRGQRWSSPTS